MQPGLCDDWHKAEAQEMFAEGINKIHILKVIIWKIRFDEERDEL